MNASEGKKSKLEGELPMKVRRRQSDAKWRANVASCYETLKHIIPVNKRASKRQISKAVILQETSKHISFLENILRTLLQEKAEKCGVNAVNQDQWVENEISGIQSTFEEKLGEKMNGMNEERRYKRNRYKRYISENMMKESIQTTASVRSVIFEQKAAEQQPKKRNLSTVTKTLKKKMRSTTRAPAAASVQEVPDMISAEGCSVDFYVNVPEQEEVDDCYVPVMPVDTVPDGNSNGFEVDVKEVTEMFLCEDDGMQQCPSFEAVRMNDLKDQSYVEEKFIPAPPSTPIKSSQKVITTPSKGTADQLLQQIGETPVKLPKDWTLCPLTPLRGNGTPGKALLSPSGFSTRSDLESDGDTQNLLCQEDMWLSDDEQDQSLARCEHTPVMENNHTSLRDAKLRPHRKRKRCDSVSSQLSDCMPSKQIKVLDGSHEKNTKDKSPTCRRSLNMNVKNEAVLDGTDDHGQEDFDGYLLFYKRMVNQLENVEPGAEAEMSCVTYDMWQQLPSNQRKTIKEMAAEERANGNSQNDMEADNGLDFDSSFYPLPEFGIINTPGKDSYVPAVPAVKNHDPACNQVAPIIVEISEVDVKPILPLSPWKSSGNPDDCTWSFTEVSPLFGSSINSILTDIKVEKQD